MFKKVFVNTASQVVGKVTTASATFLITIIIGRSQGEFGFGEFTKIFVFVGYFYTLADFGLNSIYIQIAQDKVEQKKFLKVLLGLRLIITVALAALAAAVAFILPYNSASNTGFSPLVKTGILVASATIITQGLLTTANAYFQKTLSYHLSTISVIAGALITLLGAVIVTQSGGGILGYTSVYILGGLTFTLVAFSLVYKKLGLITPTFKTDDFKLFLKRSWPVGIALVLNLIYFRIDVFILANTRSTEEVGIYGLAYQFFEASLTIPIFFANALYPLLNAVYKESKEKFAQKVKTWLALLTLFSFALTGALFVIAYIIPTIYAGKFQASIQPLQVLSLGLPLFFISAILWYVLIIYGKQKVLIPIYLSGAIFNLIANLMYIPKYGYMAAAVVTILSEAFVTALLAVVVIKESRQRT